MIHRTRLGISHWGKEMNSILGTISHPPTSSEWKMGNPKCRGDCGTSSALLCSLEGLKRFPCSGNQSGCPSLISTYTLKERPRVVLFTTPQTWAPVPQQDERREEPRVT